jgi:predicted metal-dependent peptidase
MGSDKGGTWFWDLVRSTGFLETFPHFGPLLVGLRVVDTDRCGFMAVSAADQPAGAVTLHVNRKVFEKNPDGFKGVLQHELHHVLLGHVQGPHPSEVEHSSAMQIAQEISANELIQEALPGQPVVWTAFQQYGIRPNQTTAVRYQLLVEAMEAGDWEPPARTVSACDHGDPSSLSNQPSAWMEILPNPPWNSAKERARMLHRRRQQMEAREVSVGQAAPAVEGVDWQRRLNRIVGRAPNRRQSMQRQSRRDPKGQHIGEWPGWAPRPTRHHLLVVIDTSGSMDMSIFPRIRTELKRLSSRATMTIIECDAEIRREYRYRGTFDVVMGRASTDLSPPFAKQVLARHRPDCVVYFTDGQGRFPGDDPGVRTLWVLVGSNPFDCPWGERVRMPNTK